jgi:replicative DNA helicase
MTPLRLARKLATIERRKSDFMLEPIDFILTSYELQKSKLMFVEPYWGSKKVTVDGVFEKIREGVKRYGCRLVVFDHLHFLVRGATGRDNVEQILSSATKGFKHLAQELMVPILLIAQPVTKRGGSITAEDMKGSQALMADCDHVITLNRRSIPKDYDADNTESLDPTILISLDASRFGATGSVKLHFEGRISTFMPLADRPVRKY